MLSMRLCDLLNIYGMDKSDVQPSVPKSDKKAFFIRTLACLLVIVYVAFISYSAGRNSSNECGKSVLGAQTSSSGTSILALLFNTKPEISGQQINVIELIPTATPTPTPFTTHGPTTGSATSTHGPTTGNAPTSTPSPTHGPLAAPTPTPTPFPSHGPTTYTTPTPTPTSCSCPCNGSQVALVVTPTPTPFTTHGPTTGGTTSTHGPTTGGTSTPQPTKAPLNQDQVKKIIINSGITLFSSNVTANLGAQSTTLKGELQDKILGLIKVSDPFSLTVNGNDQMTESVAKPWWQKIFTNPFAGSIKCTSLTGETACTANGCSYWGDCGKCEDKSAPYDPTCTCSSLNTQDACSSSVFCGWHSECAGGGVCASSNADSAAACQGCKNITTESACNNAGCTYSNNQCQ